MADLGYDMRAEDRKVVNARSWPCEVRQLRGLVDTPRYRRFGQTWGRFIVRVLTRSCVKPPITMYTKAVVSPYLTQRMASHHRRQ